MPRLAGMEGGAELDASDLLSEAQKEGVLGREPSALRGRQSVHGTLSMPLSRSAP